MRPILTSFAETFQKKNRALIDKGRCFAKNAQFFLNLAIVILYRVFCFAARF